MTPNLDVLPKAEAVYEKAIADHPDQNTMKLAYENFLRDAVVILFTSGRGDQARLLFDEIKRRFPSEQLPADLESFLYRSITGDAPRLSREDAMTMLEELERQSFFWQALGENSRADGFNQLAEICRQKTIADSGENLPSLKQIRESARERVLANPPSTKTRERLTPDAGT